MVICTTQLPGSFEDDVLTVLVQWLRQLTGVKTIRAYEGAKPPDGQYITVFVNSYEDYDGWPVRQFLSPSQQNSEGCEVIRQVRRILLDINVYRDHGELVDLERYYDPSDENLNDINYEPATGILTLMFIDGHTKTIQVQQPDVPFRSAIDVANAIVLRSELFDQLEKLETNCITLEDFGPVQNLRELVKNDYESRAYVQMQLLAEMNESGRLAWIDKAKPGTCFDDASVLIDSNSQPAMGC